MFLGKGGLCCKNKKKSVYLLFLWTLLKAKQRLFFRPQAPCFLTQDRPGLNLWAKLCLHM